MAAKKAVSWVVYKMALRNAESQNAVCEQSEWDDLERDRPGQHTLVRSGITNEGEAERLARGTSADGLKSGYAKKASHQAAQPLQDLQGGGGGNAADVPRAGN